MARIDRDRLTGASFPVVEEIATRIADIDMQGHVNNAALGVILQEARARFNARAGLPALLGGARAMIAAITIEYAREMHYPAPLVVATGVLALGRSSLTLGQVARQDGRDTAFAEVTMVIADAQGPRALPQDLRAAFETLRIVRP